MFETFGIVLVHPLIALLVCSISPPTGPGVLIFLL